MFQEELQLKLEKSVFWTDSTTFLKYICIVLLKPGDFTLLLRIESIREAPNDDQWRYVGSKENPADYVLCYWDRRESFVPLQTSIRMSWRLMDLQWKGKFRALKPRSKESNF